MKKLPILFTYDDVKGSFSNIKCYQSFLFRSLKSNKIKQIKKGLYALTDRLTNNVFATKYNIASKLFPDSYFSYLEALAFYGFAPEPSDKVFHYLSHTYTSDLTFNGVVYKSKKSVNPLQIVNMIDTNKVRVVSLERAIIDSIDCPQISGGIEPIISALTKINESSVTIQCDKIRQLLEFYNKKYLFQKVGYLFEKYLSNKVDQKLISYCADNIGNNVYYLVSNGSNRQLNNKWKLIVCENPKDIVRVMFYSKVGDDKLILTNQEDYFPFLELIIHDDIFLGRYAFKEDIVNKAKGKLLCKQPFNFNNKNWKLYLYEFDVDCYIE